MNAVTNSSISWERKSPSGIILIQLALYQNISKLTVVYLKFIIIYFFASFQEKGVLIRQLK